MMPSNMNLGSLLPCNVGNNKKSKTQSSNVRYYNASSSNFQSVQYISIWSSGSGFWLVNKWTNQNRTINYLNPKKRELAATAYLEVFSPGKIILKEEGLPERYYMVLCGQGLRRVFKFMLVRWHSGPIKSLNLENQPIRGWAKSINLKTGLRAKSLRLPAGNVQLKSKTGSRTGSK